MNKKELLEYFINYIEQNGSNRLFKLDVINYEKRTSDTKELYSEVLAKNLLAKDFYNLLWDANKPISQYKKIIKYEHIPSDEGQLLTYSDFFTYRIGPEAKQIGYTVEIATDADYDYERPKPHLITYNDKIDTLFFIIEEPENSKNTALNCCLRLRDMMKHLMLDGIENSVDMHWTNISYSVRPAIFVFEGSLASNEFKDKSRVQLQKLVRKLGIKVIHTTWN